MPKLTLEHAKIELDKINALLVESKKNYEVGERYYEAGKENYKNAMERERVLSNQLHELRGK